MTATNVFITKDAAHLFTDGAVMIDNVFRSVASKVILLPHLSCAMAVAGTTAVRMLVEAVIVDCNPKDFDALARKMGKALERGTNENPDGMQHGQFSVLLAGYSLEAAAFRAFAMSGVDGAGFLAFKPKPVKRFCIPFDKTTDAMPLDDEKHAVAIMEYQRRMGQITATGAQFAIGGFCKQTTVERNQIATRIIHRWPDDIGKPIAP